MINERDRWFTQQGMIGAASALLMAVIGAAIIVPRYDTMTPWQRVAALALIGIALVGFGVHSVWLAIKYRRYCREHRAPK